MTSIIKLLNAPRATVLTAAFFASVTLAAAQQTHLPCPENKDEIGAGTCPDPETGMKRVEPKDTDQASTEKAEPPAEVKMADADGRDDGSDLQARAKQRQERIDILTREAKAPLATE